MILLFIFASFFCSMILLFLFLQVFFFWPMILLFNFCNAAQTCDCLSFLSWWSSWWRPCGCPSLNLFLVRTVRGSEFLVRIVRGSENCQRMRVFSENCQRMRVFGGAVVVLMPLSQLGASTPHWWRPALHLRWCTNVALNALQHNCSKLLHFKCSAQLQLQ